MDRVRAASGRQKPTAPTTRLMRTYCGIVAFCAVRLGPAPMGEYFSGSSAVTSRNSLLHDGATNATRSRRFRPRRGAAIPLSRSRSPSDRALATPNFRELFFHALR
jgi:hypothetical protein